MLTESGYARSPLKAFYQRLEELGEPDPQILMITLCGVASAVRPTLFSECIERNTDEAWDSLTKTLCLRGFEETTANRFASNLRALPRGLLQDIADLIPGIVTPSPDLAEELLEELHRRRRNRASYSIPGDLAQIICHIGFGFYNNPTTAICQGANADMLAIQAAQYAKTTYFLSGVGLGVAYKDCLKYASGDNYRIVHQQVATDSSTDRDDFISGFLADFWGHSRPLIRNVDGEKIPGYSELRSEVRNLPDLLKKVDGRVVAVVPVSWLLRTVGEDAIYKKALINKGQIEAVVQLPERCIMGTGLPFALLVLNTAMRSNEIKFIDATGDKYAQRSRLGAIKFTEDGKRELLRLIDGRSESDDMVLVASEDALLDMGSLDPLKHVRYAADFLGKGGLSEFVPLEEVVDIIQCQAIRSMGDKPSAYGDYLNDTREEIELGPSDIDAYGFLRVGKEVKRLTPDHAAEKRAERQRLNPGDIVLAVKGRVGLSAYVDEEVAGCIGNQSFVILRVRNGPEAVDSRVLHHFFRSDRFRELLESRVKGSAVRIMKMADLKQLPIPRLDGEQSARVVESWDHVYEKVMRIREIERVISRELNEFWDG